MPFNGGARISVYLGSWLAAINFFAAHASCPAAGLHREELHEQHELCKSGPNYALLQDAFSFFGLVFDMHLALGKRRLSIMASCAICMPKCYLPDSFSYDVEIWSVGCGGMGFL